MDITMFINHINFTMASTFSFTVLFVSLVCCVPLSSDPKNSSDNLLNVLISDTSVGNDFEFKEKNYKPDFVKMSNVVTEESWKDIEKDDYYSRISPLASGKYLIKDFFDKTKYTDLDERHKTAVNLLQDLVSESDETFQLSGDGYFSLSGNGYGNKRKNKRDTRRYDSFRYSDNHVPSSTYAMYSGCHRLHSFSEKPLYMIDSCPAMSDFDLIKLCQMETRQKNINWWRNGSIDILHIPVQNPEGYVFKNIYCSACHGVANASVWAAGLICDDISPLVVFDGEQTLELLKNAAKPAKCSLQLYPSDMSGITFCENVEHFYNHGAPHNRVRQIGYDSSEPATQTLFPLSFQMFVNFGMNGKLHVVFSSGPAEPIPLMQCNGDEIYDPYSKKCRKVTCRDGYQLIEYKCQPVTQSFSVDDTTNEELEHLKDSGRMTKLTFNLNPSCEILEQLKNDSAKEDVAIALRNFFNISMSRIENITIDILNKSDSDVYLQVETVSDNMKNRKTSGNTNISTEQTDSKIVDDNDEAKGVQNASLTSVSGYAPSQTTTPEVARSPEKDDRISPYPPDPSKKSEKMDMCEKQNIAKISFVLIPITKKTLKEKNNDVLIQEIKKLVVKNSFSIDLNGKDLKINKFKNGLVVDPVVLDTWCLGGVKHFYTEKQIDFREKYDPNKNATVQGIFVNSTKTFYSPGMFDLTMWVDGKFGSVTNGKFGSFSNISTFYTIFVCKLPAIADKKCGVIDVSKDEYTVVPENKSVLFQKRYYDMSEYEYVNHSSGEIRLCIPESFFGGEILPSAICGKSFTTVTIAEGYLSFILGIISLAAMTTVLVTYSLFEKLRNLPGVNTMNLTLALFLSELAFISSGYIKTDLHWLCRTVGVLLHFLILTTFFWTSVMSYDVFRTFANKCILTRVRSKRKYALRYALFGWGAPACIVVTCAIIDFTQVIPNVRFAYGAMDPKHGSPTPLLATALLPADNNSTSGGHNPFHMPTKQNFGCWIQEPVASLVAFGLPMILILIANSIMFIRTIICIRAVTKLAHFKTRRSSINQVTGKQDVMLYVRMSTVMGFTWIFGLASSIVSAFADTPSETSCIILHCLGILFVVLNSCQGLFIFFAFIFNRRVFSLYRELFSNFKQKFSQLSSSPSTASSTTTISTVK